MDTGGKNTQEQDQIRICTAPIVGPETSTVLEGILGRLRWTVTPSGGKDSDSSGSRITSIILILFLFFDLICRITFFLFVPLLL